MTCTQENYRDLYPHLCTKIDELNSDSSSTYETVKYLESIHTRLSSLNGGLDPGVDKSYYYLKSNYLRLLMSKKYRSYIHDKSISMPKRGDVVMVFRSSGDVKPVVFSMYEDHNFYFYDPENIEWSLSSCRNMGFHKLTDYFFEAHQDDIDSFVETEEYKEIISMIN